jgi:hypothetical protein
MSLIDTIKEALGSKGEVDRIKEQVEAGEITPEQVLEQLGDKLTVEIFGAEFLTPKGEEEEPKADKNEADPEMVERLSAVEAENKKLQSELLAEKVARRQEALSAEAKKFAALPVKVDEFASNMLTLEDKAPEAAKWVREQFAAADKALQEAGLLREIGTGEETNLADADRFLALVGSTVKEKFNGDMAKYDEAMAIVESEHPRLAQAYADRVG